MAASFGVQGGGGYLPASGDGKSPEKERTASNCIMPITWKMMHTSVEAHQDTLFLDGVGFKEVVIVGRLISQTVASNRIELEITDDTGIGKVVFYKKQTAGDQPAALKDFQYMPNKYVKVYGKFTNSMNEKHLIANSLKDLESFNEITHHFLNVFLMTQQRRKGPLPEEEKQETSATNTFNTNPGKMLTGQNNVPMAMNGSENHSPDVLMVINAFKDLLTVSKDVHTEQLKTHLAGRIDDMRLNNIIAELESAGTIYPTVDEFHFKLV